MKVRYTVPSDASRVGYSTNGSTTVFSIPFVFFDNTDLQVILVNNTTAVETTLTLTTNYTVTGGNGSTGSLTTVSTYASGSTLVIQREVPYTQEIDYQANDGFPADVNEEGLDRATMQVQQVRRRARQTPQLPATYDPESGDITFPMPVAGQVLVGNGGETGWNSVPLADIDPDIVLGSTLVVGVSSVAAIASVTPPDPSQLVLAGYTGQTDNGGGILVLESGSSETVDNGLIFPTPSLVGRYRRLTGGVLSTDDFGIVKGGSTSQAARVQDWINACWYEKCAAMVSAGSSTTGIHCGGETIYINSTGALGDTSVLDPFAAGGGTAPNGFTMYGEHQRYSVLGSVAGPCLLSIGAVGSITGSGNAAGKVNFSRWHHNGNIHCWNLQTGPVFQDIRIVPVSTLIPAYGVDSIAYPQWDTVDWNFGFLASQCNHMELRGVRMEPDALALAQGGFFTGAGNYQLHGGGVQGMLRGYVTKAYGYRSRARINSTAYALGYQITVASNPGFMFYCTTAGTSAGSEPAGYATAINAGTVTDGTAVFTAETLATKHRLLPGAVGVAKFSAQGLHFESIANECFALNDADQVNVSDNHIRGQLTAHSAASLIRIGETAVASSTCQSAVIERNWIYSNGASVSPSVDIGVDIQRSLYAHVENNRFQYLATGISTAGSSVSGFRQNNNQFVNVTTSLTVGASTGRWREEAANLTPLALSPSTLAWNLNYSATATLLLAAAGKTMPLPTNPVVGETYRLVVSKTNVGDSITTYTAGLRFVTAANNLAAMATTEKCLFTLLCTGASEFLVTQQIFV